MFVKHNFHNPTGHGPHTIVTVTNTLLGIKRKATIPSRLVGGWMVHSFLKGKMVQEAFPTLNKSEREFILSGMNAEDQARFFDPPHDVIRFPIVDVK